MARRADGPPEETPAAPVPDAQERERATAEREVERSVTHREPIPFVWRGIAWWRCPLCPWDRDDEAAVRAHVAANHPAPGMSVTDRLAAEAEAARAAAETSVTTEGSTDA